MCGSAMRKNISPALCRRLLEHVRSILEHRLGLSGEPDRSDLDDESLQQQCGTFVTLKINGALRGCIGNIEADGTIVDSIERNALSAAFHDHRFKPLKAEELARVEIDISILSSPEPLDYRDGDDLISKLRPLVDGVILRHGRSSATFLPQVWSQLPDPVIFLEHLCQKAGLSPSLWQKEHPDIYIYQVQCCEEEKR